MTDVALVVGATLAVAVLLGRALARRLQLPDAVALVACGVAASFIPSIPEVRLHPEVVFLVFLPPLLYHSGFLSAPRETKENAGSIAGLAFGATAATAGAVALVAHAVIPGLDWPAAVALGAAVAPTDPVAATAVLQRLGAPSRVLAVLEGESLVNDGAALTIFGLAVGSIGAAVTFDNVIVRAVVYVVGGLLTGLLVGFLVGRLRRRITDPNTQIVISLVTPFLAYIPTERAGASGVLATVAAAIYLGTVERGLLQPTSRLQARTVWSVLTLLLESVLFVVLGLQIRTVAAGVGDIAVSDLALDAAAVVAVVVGVRFVWQALAPPLGSRIRGLRTGQFTMPRRQRFAVGFSGLRGAISLAIVLSIPEGAALSNRELLVFLTAVVVLVTLVGGSVGLPPLLRGLGLATGQRQREEAVFARRYLAEAALRRLDEANRADEVDDRAAATLRQLFELRLERLRGLLGENDGDGQPDEPPDVRPMRLELILAQRRALEQLYTRRRVGADTFRDVAEELDRDESRQWQRRA